MICKGINKIMDIIINRHCEIGTLFGLLGGLASFFTAYCITITTTEQK